MASAEAFYSSLIVFGNAQCTFDSFAVRSAFALLWKSNKLKIIVNGLNIYYIKKLLLYKILILY